MAESYGFFNGIEYGESFVALVNKTLVKTGVFFDGLSCSGNSMNVVVSAGSANLDGFLYNNDSELSLEVETAHATLPRIDSVMIRHDISSRRINAVIVKGTAQSNPSAPSPVRNKSYYDLKIADVLIPGGASSVSTITDTRGDADVCGLVTGYDTADLATITNRLTSLEARDYIVEQGTSGNWTWRKWSIGLQELFYRGEYKSFSTLKASGSIYYADVLQNIVYPVTFLEVPIVTSAFQTGMQGSSELSNVWAWTSGHTETGFKHMYLARGTNVAVGGIPTFVAVGRWK